MEEEEEELEAMEEDGEDGEPQRRLRGKRPVVPYTKPLDDYPGGPTTLPCCGGTMCTWPRRRLRARYLLMLNFL
jgi:hypothetical protein